MYHFSPACKEHGKSWLFGRANTHRDELTRMHYSSRFQTQNDSRWYQEMIRTDLFDVKLMKVVYRTRKKYKLKKIYHD